MTELFPTIKTDRLLLRQFVDADLENVYKGLSHPDVIKYYGVSFNSLAATKAQMTWFKKLEKNRNGIWWAICSSVDQEFYGAGGLNNINELHKKAEVGFWLLPAHWSKGIMSEAMPLICDYGFDKVGLHRIEGFVETKNQNCIKALTKLDFKKEDTMSDCEVKNGAFISLDIYAKFKQE